MPSPRLLWITFLAATLWITSGPAAADPAGEHRADRSGLADRPDAIRPLLIGSEVPPVHVTDLSGQRRPLRELIGTEPALLIFYRGGW